MSSHTLSQHHFSQAMELFKSGRPYTEIEQYLATEGLQGEEITKVMNFIYEERYAKRRKRGYTLIFTGAALLLLGFGYTMMESLAGGHDTNMLVIMTSIGSLVAFVGLVDLFG